MLPKDAVSNTIQKHASHMTVAEAPGGRIIFICRIFMTCICLMYNLQKESPATTRRDTVVVVCLSLFQPQLTRPRYPRILATPPPNPHM